jgi:FixJ family two-component response regulator
MTADAPAPIVFIVDDDESIRELLAWLMRREGLDTRTFANARDFVEVYRPEQPGCLLLDLNMPGMSGLDLQEYLNEHDIVMPVIFLSGRADIAKAVRAVKGGAVDFIEKPFDYRQIVALVHDCLARDAAMRSARGQELAVAERFAQLSQREHEVMELVVAGKLNREIAGQLDISIKTVEAHRARLMEKLGAGSVADLVQAVVLAKQKQKQ